jgi:PAS domain S-box-containing protein
VDQSLTHTRVTASRKESARLLARLVALRDRLWESHAPFRSTEQSDQEPAVLLSTAPAGPRERRLAIAVVVVSALAFAATVPFVRVPLARVPAFIPSYESALTVNDLITAILLFAQFARVRSYALLALAAGYLFDAMMIVPHMLTFPAVFSETGLLGAGDQTTAWLYIFWHGGFPLFVLAYAWLADDKLVPGSATVAIARTVGLVTALVCGFVIVTTAAADRLPVLVQNGNYGRVVSTGVGPAVWLLSLAALVALWRRKRETVLDLWLTVVMAAWLMDVALSSILGSARYDLGWYMGRSYGLMAASFVLAVLLVETISLHGRLAQARAELADRARELERRVRERTEELRASISTLRTEVAERRQAEQRLNETREFLHVIVESLPAMLLVKDARDGKCILLNRAGEELLGCERSEIIGKSADDFLPPREDAEPIDLLDRQAVLSVAACGTHEHRLKTRHQGERVVRTNTAPVLDERGEGKYMLSFSEDVTQQRQTEDQLRHAQKMEALGELTGGLAHDFNNLLAIVIGNLDILKELGTGDPAKDALVADAIGAALSGGELTRRLLAFARRQPLQPQQIDLNELIGGISKLLFRTLGEDIEISLDLDPTVSAIVADRAQLETAIANLANNARDAMPGGGKLTIATRPARLGRAYAAQHAEVTPGDYVAVEVTDTGHGMTAETRDRIFEPFFTTKGLGQGTGLGLSMVFGFMKQTGGHINVYSEPGHGTVFRLYFPPSVAGSEPVFEAPSLQPAQGQGETVLVVEDNAKLREIVARQLLSLGFRVFEVGQSRAALDLMASLGGVDLLLTDVILPGDMDGCALAREARLRYPRTKILLTSGFPGARIAEAMRPEAGLRLLSKPYRKDDLMRVIREVLDERA